jgi:hypothetical protein
LGGPLGFVEGPVPGGGGRISFFTVGTLISIFIIGSGIYFIVQGVSGEVELETDIGKLKTNVVGIALVVIGAALYLGIGKILLGKDSKD